MNITKELLQGALKTINNLLTKCKLQIDMPAVRLPYNRVIFNEKITQ